MDQFTHMLVHYANFYQSDTT